MGGDTIDTFMQQAVTTELSRADVQENRGDQGRRARGGATGTMSELPRHHGDLS